SVGYGLTFTDTTANYRYRLNDFSSMISFIGGGFDFNTSPFGTAGNTIPYTTVMSILQNGKVGIGTTAPMWKLHVVDATSNGTGIRGENSYAGSAFGTGVYGKSVNSPGSGSGVKGQGGFSGVFGEGYGTTFVGTTHGVYGYASGSAGTRTGVYGTAVGGTINYGVYCNGSGVYTGTWTDISDQKFKKELAPVAGALGLINQLNPVSYQLKTDEYPMMNFPAFRQYGFVAQEMEKVIPLLVENGTHPGATIEDKDIEFKTVNYIGMIPILTKAIQELSKENEELKSEVRSQKSEIELIKSVLSAEQQEKLNEAIIETTGKLEQNFPNPFNSQTEIKFQLPAKFSVAQLIIYDSNGKQIRSYDLQTSTSVIIKAGELSAGAYTYSLVIDELVVDSKQMVLTK
ncbi:MAG: tail fiber domain-containing protein, partial [Bacteroidia bacterium]